MKTHMMRNKRCSTIRAAMQEEVGSLFLSCLGLKALDTIGNC